MKNGGGYCFSTHARCWRKDDCKCLAGSHSWLIVVKVWRKKDSKLLVGTDSWFSCGKSCNKMRNCPSFYTNKRYHSKAMPSSSGSSSLKWNLIYALQTQHDQGSSPDVVTSMFKFFHINVYSLLNLGVTLSLVMLYVSMRFYVFQDVLLPLLLSLLLFVNISLLIKSLEIFRSSYPIESLMLI